MLGLPPTPAQMDAALAMPFANLADELLTSPHYGERWARHWLDAARFAESHGFEQDYDRKFAYHYRDFVINGAQMLICHGINLSDGNSPGMKSLPMTRWR